MTRPKPSKELATIDAALSIPQMKERAELLVKSGFLPKAIKTAEQAIAIMLMGAEYGIPPMKAFQSIHVIEGKPTLSAQLMLALCERTGELEDKKFEIHDSYAAVTLKRKGQTEYRAVFGDDDARLMKTKEAQYNDQGSYVGTKVISLIEKYNYRTMKKDMFVARATSRACRRVFPDAVLGLYVPEEAYDVIDPGEEARTDAAAQIAGDAAKKTEELAAPVEAAAGTVHEQAAKDELYLTVASYYIQDATFAKTYPARALSEILGERTPAGKHKGRTFLEKVAEKSTVAEDRAKIKTFLELIDAEPAPEAPAKK